MFQTTNYKQPGFPVPFIAILMGIWQNDGTSLTFHKTKQRACSEMGLS